MLNPIIKFNVCILYVFLTENFPNLEKAIPYPLRYRQPPGHQTDLTKIEQPHDISSLKQQAQRIEKEY
jgi:hypothetical protein